MPVNERDLGWMEKVGGRSSHAQMGALGHAAQRRERVCTELGLASWFLIFVYFVSR